MPQITVGDPNATLRAVEKALGVPVSVTGSLAWSITPSDGSVAELAPGPTADTMLFVAKAPGGTMVTVTDSTHSLTASIAVDVLAGSGPVPDSIEIEFTAGS